MGLLDRFFKTKSPKRNKDTGTALERYNKSFHHAIDGIIYVIKSELNMKIHLLAVLIVTICGFVFHISKNSFIVCIILFKSEEKER